MVIGGGLAGIAAAASLLEQGFPVTLVEARHFLGGRVFSFPDAATGQEVDNGQHIFLGCCTHYIEFLKRLGVFQRFYLQPRLRVPVHSMNGQRSLLAAARLPAPFHLLPALLAYPHMSCLDKWRVVSTLLRARNLDRHQPELEDISFYQWLKEQGHSERAIRTWWDFLITPTLNDDSSQVSASMGLMIFQEGVLAGRHHADLGYALEGLSQVADACARKYLESLGGRLRLSRRTLRFLAEHGRISGVELAGGEKISGDIYISAVPPDMLLKLLPQDMRALPFFQRVQGLEFSPIVNVHLWYDRPVMDEVVCAFVDGPLQWVFNKSRIMSHLAPAEDEQSQTGQYLCISLSAAWQHVDQPQETLVQQFVAAISQAFPRARDAQVRRALVVKQRQATFRPRPGAGALRPACRTPVDNLFLAGEWTDTGWPSTMESAVRSGYNVAQAVADGM